MESGSRVEEAVVVQTPFEQLEMPMGGTLFTEVTFFNVSGFELNGVIRI
jgi:hypothetical protein